jgi:putative cardiolipin synthase
MRDSPAVRTVLAVLLGLSLPSACAYPRLTGTFPESRAFDRPGETRIGRHVAAEDEAQAGKSGIHVLNTGLDSFAARIALIEHAEQALDVQYYIFHDDVTGLYLLSRLLAAADRGVRVRLLLDDLGAAGIDELVSAADVHPGIEVRLFNPFARGPWPGLARMLDLLRRPHRLNRRMHNKMLTADGAAGIVGGRNVGDEYFGAREDVNFADLDLLAFGPVNEELGKSFDQYWNSPFAVPVSAWRRLTGTARDLENLRSRLAEHELTHAESPYALRLRGTGFVQEALAGELELIWAPTHVVADLPGKVVARGDELRATQLSEQLGPVWPPAESDLLIVSPYFVPRDEGTEYLLAQVGRGVRVRVLTNSLAATDVPAVHAGYKAYRRELLEGGVELFELRPTGDALEKARERFGSSSASLHAKTFVSDGRRAFVGSLNLSPRSLELNTELALVVDDARLAARLARDFEHLTRPSLSWRLSLERAEGGCQRMLWEGEERGRVVRHHRDPGTSCSERFSVWLLGLLPIEGQL